MDPRHPALSSRASSALIVVDVQERITSVMSEPERLMTELGRLVTGAQQLGVPTLVTEQYPKGLGPTVGSLLEAAGNPEPVQKLSFSCFGEPAFVERVRELEREELVICGIEAHVCVAQTVLDALARGFRVKLVADAVSSRSAFNRDLALQRLANEGATLTCVESVLFEWLDRCDDEHFKAIAKLVK